MAALAGNVKLYNRNIVLDAGRQSIRELGIPDITTRANRSRVPFVRRAGLMLSLQFFRSFVMLAKLFNGTMIMAYKASDFLTCACCQRGISQGAYYTRYRDYKCCRECRPFKPVSSFWSSETQKVEVVLIGKDNAA